jgi:glutathione S-transferase
MKLYVWANTPNPRRVKMFLAEKKLDIPLEDAGMVAELPAAFVEKSPHRLVPMLELDDGSVLTEAMAICRYIEALHPEPPLFGRTPLESARIDMWERICEQQGVQAAAEVFRNAIPAFKDRGLGGYATTIPQIAALVERGKLRYEAFIEKIDAQLAMHHYIAGDAFSVADITALVAIDFAKRARMPLPERCQYVKGWYEEVSARPSARA